MEQVRAGLAVWTLRLTDALHLDKMLSYIDRF